MILSDQGQTVCQWPQQQDQWPQQQDQWPQQKFIGLQHPSSDIRSNFVVRVDEGASNKKI
jgi:hypothetical protein